MTEQQQTATRIAELEADNRRLRQMLDQRDAPGELRHRLRNTVAMLRAIIRKSATKPRELEAYTHYLEGRLDALARAQAEADTRGGSDLHKLVTDELLQYDCGEGERLVIQGCDLYLKARAGQVFALAIHELAVNSVEHGALGAGGRLTIGWTMSAQAGEPMLEFIWREELDQSSASPGAEGFGTEVLRNMLGYELRAVTSLDLSPGAFACTISFPFTAQVGSLSSAAS